MAFVFRSEKTSSLSPSKYQNELGPGQYLAQTSYVPTKKAKVAFMVGSKKKEKKKVENDIPGPGAYYKDEMKEKLEKTLMKSQQAKQELETNLKAYSTLNNISNLDNLEYGDNIDSVSNLVNNKNLERLGFLTRDKRFKENNKDVETPGPGYYIKPKTAHNLRSSSGKNFSRGDKLLFKFFTSDIKDKNKVVSIPTKEQSFGYDIDPNGGLKMIGDPELYKHFKGERNDTVGPGNYELDDNTWLKKGTRWSKSRTPKLIFAEKNESTTGEKNTFRVKLSKSYEDLDYEFRAKTSDILAKKNEIKKVLNNNEIRKKNRQTVIKEMLQASEPIETFGPLHKQFAKENPGPGYYYDKRSASSFKVIRYPEFKQNFQSNLQRFKEPPKNEGLGPGSYFQEDGKVYSEKKLKEIKQKMFNPINTRIKSKIEKTRIVLSEKEVDETPGPGQYDPSKEFQKVKNYSNHTHFGSTEKRFVEFTRQTKSITPGPGSYIDSNSTAYSTIGGVTQNKWFNPGKSDGFKRFTMNDIKKKNLLKTGKIREEKAIEIKEKEIKPAVGTYYPEIVTSIEYKVQKNCNKMSMVEAAFNSTISKARFENEKIEEANPGPGFYYREKRIQPAQMYPPFKSKDIRFRPNKTDINLGPGNYNQTNYFDWNKKTFNILYL